MDTDLLAELVEFDTNSDSKNSYTECSRFIKERAEAAGLHVEMHTACPPDGKPRPNLIIEFDAGAEQTLLLATHYDVVPAGEGWKHEPFKLTIEGKRAYGRGAADDKGGIASALASLQTLRGRGSSKVNVKLLVTCDEEVGGEHGLGFLMQMKEKGRFLVEGDAALLIDAGPHAYVGSSGRISGRINAEGSLQQLLSLISAVVDYSQTREKVVSKLTDTSAKRRIWGRISVTMLDLNAGIVEVAKGECRIRLTENTGLKKFLPKGKFRLQADELVILGRQGHAGYPHMYKNAIENALPLLRKVAELSQEKGKCELVFDLRTIPEESLDSALTAFKRYLKVVDPRAELEVLEGSEGYVLSGRHPLVRMLQRAIGENKAYGMLGATDVQFFSRRGIPSICFGPISDSSNIHGKDEFVRIKDIEFVSDALVKLCENWVSLKTYPCE